MGTIEPIGARAGGDAPRRVIVHYHLFKNGGSSIERMLREGFGDAWTSFDREASGARISADELVGFLRERPGLRAVSSHQLVTPVPACDDIEIVPILFLRDPLARVRSAWLFEWQKQGGLDAPRGTLAEYVESKLDHSDVNVIANFQVSRLSNADPGCARQSFGRHDRDALGRACALLDGLPFFGLVERFADSLELMRPTMRDAFPDLELVEHRENVLQAGGVPDPARRLREALDDALYDALLVRNVLDLELLAYARGLFQARLESLRADAADGSSGEAPRAARIVRAVRSRLTGAARG